MNIWSRDKLSPYIDAKVLFKYLKINYTEIFQKYFQIFENRVSIHNFVVFVCIFIFGDADDILRILLSVCGVHSNVAISYFHCLNIVKSIYPNALTDDKLSKWMSHLQTSEIISVHEFIKAIKSSIIMDILDTIKNNLVEIVIGKSNYEAICNRSYYYNIVIFGNENYSNGNDSTSDNNSSSNNGNKNKNRNTNNRFTLYTYESCFSKLVRILFTHKPPPLFTEYNYNSVIGNETQVIPMIGSDLVANGSDYSSNGNNGNQYEPVVALIRARYGYSRRHTSSTNKKSLRRKTLCSSRNSSRRSKYLAKANGKSNYNTDSTKHIHCLSETHNQSSNQIVTDNVDL